MVNNISETDKDYRLERARSLNKRLSNLTNSRTRHFNQPKTCIQLKIVFRIQILRIKINKKEMICHTIQTHLIMFPASTNHPKTIRREGKMQQLNQIFRVIWAAL